MSSDEQSEKECPLCMEQLELDDVSFYPCKCDYQICRFCWHRIRTDENGLCPACRQPYPEDPANFKPLSPEELQRIKNEKKQKQQRRRQKMSDSRKHLANFRVLQKNLVYVIGLSPRVADPDILKKGDFFGKYGKIVKVVVGNIGTVAQSSSCTAYVTYLKADDALRAIQAVNNVHLDGKLVKASLGTTKYCSSFLRNQQCHKQECMYLHEVAETEVSFTKDDMHQGKHAEYERRLAEQVFNCVIAPLEKPAIHRRSPKYRQSSSESVEGMMRIENGHSTRHRSKQTSKSVERRCETNSELPCLYSSNRCISQESLHRDSTPDITVGSVPIDTTTIDEHPMRQQQQQQQQLPTSRLFIWTKPAQDSYLRGGTCNSVEKEQFLTNGLNRSIVQNVHSKCADLATTDWQTVLGLNVNTNEDDIDEYTARSRLSSVHSDDELGFDPFSESSKGLADLLEEEKRAEKLDSQHQFRQRQINIEPAVRFQQNLQQHRHHQYQQSNSFTGQSFLSSNCYSTSSCSSSSPSSSFPLIRPPNQFTSPPPNVIGQQQLTNGVGPFDTAKNNYPQYEPTNGYRNYPASRSMAFPPPGLSGTSQRPTSTVVISSQPRSLSPQDQSYLNVHQQQQQQQQQCGLTDWQKELKALLPNANVHFSPELQAGTLNQTTSPGSTSWLHHPPPPMPPFTLPPPSLSVPSTSLVGQLKPSPPNDSSYTYQINGPPMAGPPPSSYHQVGTWSSISPPPPGSSTIKRQ